MPAPPTRRTALALLLALAAAGPLPAQGKKPLVWGADKTGGGPYLYEDDGTLKGFEVELADYLARRLGTAAEFRQGQWDKLPDMLLRDDLDIVLNGYEWSADRDKQTPTTIPYYVYKLQLLAGKGNAAIRDWDDLRKPRAGGTKQRVGVLIGSAAERYMQDKFGDAIELRSYQDVTSSLQLINQGGDLDASVQDTPLFVFYGREFLNIVGVGRPLEPGYYVALTRPEDKQLREQLNAALRDGLKDGTLRGICRKYGLWNRDQKELFEKAGLDVPPDDYFAEGGDVAGPPKGLTFGDMVETLGLAALKTVQLACISMPLAMLLGLLVAVGRLYGPLWLRVPLGFYVEFLRGTPLLLQLYVIYYLLPGAGIAVPAFWAAIIGLSINYSAYEAENYRAGLLAVPRGQMEAALALGMTPRTALFRVVIPQAVRTVIPPVTNDFIALFKDTSVCSVIAVTELTGRYNQLYNNNPGLVLQLGLVTACLYMLMSYPLSLVARRLERRLPKGVPA